MYIVHLYMHILCIYMFLYICTFFYIFIALLYLVFVLLVFIVFYKSDAVFNYTTPAYAMLLFHLVNKPKVTFQQYFINSNTINVLPLNVTKDL